MELASSQETWGFGARKQSRNEGASKMNHSPPRFLVMRPKPSKQVICHARWIMFFRRSYRFLSVIETPRSFKKTVSKSGLVVMALI